MPPNISSRSQISLQKIQKNNLDLIAVLLISFSLLLVCAFTATFIAYPLLISLTLFAIALIWRGFAVKELLHMAWAGARRSLPVVAVLLLIGMITAVWVAAGTVPALVYYGVGLISGRFFVLWAFLLTGALSVLIGTSFGAVGTIGIALMVLARGSGVEPNPVAGAIIAGAFVGDRCSLMSSSAHLVASVTHTSIYNNIQNMVRSSRWPLAITLILYAALSLLHPVTLSNRSLTTELQSAFDLSWIVLLPAAAVFALALLKVNVKLAMLVSLGLGWAIAHHVQHYSFLDLAQFTLFGYSPRHSTPLRAILLGGGLLPMLKATLVVLISTAFAGIFTGSHTLSFVDSLLKRIQSERQLRSASVLVAAIANLFGCTQTIAIVLTGQIMRPHYRAYWPDSQHGADERLAIALEDTAVVIAPLVPWNIAGLIPATVLAVGPGFIPYAAIYLLLLPLFFALRR
jgi:NhaC family Na+:H+ antiporter